MSYPYTEEFTLLALGLMVVLIRISARIGSVGFRNLFFDDYLMVVAAGIYIAETSLAWSVDGVFLGMANNGMTDDQRAAVVTGSDEYWLRVGGSKLQVAGQNSYTALLWTLKTAVCCFYLRLTKTLKGYEYRIKFAFGFIAVTWLAVHMTLFAGCIPFYKYWQINPDPGNFCQAAISEIFLLTSVILDVLTDAYLLSIPLPMLWVVDLPVTQKAGLSIIFSGAIFVMTAALLRCIMIMTDSVDGAANSGYWACRETFVAVMTSNIPVVWSSMRIFARKRRLPSGPRARVIVADMDAPNSHEMSNMSSQHKPSLETEGHGKADVESALSA